MTPDRVGVFAYLVRDGQVRVVLVRSRDGDRWGVPKGRLKRGMSRRDVAALEAWEEAGVRGRFRPKGSVDVSWTQKGRDLTMRLYPLAVRKVGSRWPERHVRRRKVVSLKRACRMVRDPALRAALRALARTVPQGRGEARVGRG